MFKERLKQKDKVKIVLDVHKFVIEELHLYSKSCPTIWTGFTKEGKSIYIYYNWAKLSVRLAEKDEEPHFGKEIISVMYGKDLTEGDISIEEIAKLCEDRFDFSNVLDLQNRD